MSEERLQEIKDSIDLQLTVAKSTKIRNELADEEKELYDAYINLQQENERLKELKENASKVCVAEHKYGVEKAEEARDYKSRCEKAISYIKEKGIYNEEYNLCTQPINSMKLDNLLNILQGSDKE